MQGSFPNLHFIPTMNLNNPDICRALAVMIQQIAPESREQFRNDAEKAPDMETFMKGLNKYETV